MKAAEARVVLLTGASGFVGKVVLHDLFCRRHELNLAGVIAVIRRRGPRTGHDRFTNEVATAECFAGLPADWTRLVTVLDGDLASPEFGTQPGDAALLNRVTQVIHAAAAVSFTLPGPTAARANITTSVNLLTATHACPRLRRIVYVSTAYVTPHHDGKIAERLVALPAPADELWSMLESGAVADTEMLARTGHPNTYALTKTIAEHLLAEGCHVPLSIVRPSIITASRARPMPGWIDSAAGFGAFVTLIGLGHLRAVVGDPLAQLDLVAVDDVSQCVIDEVAAGAAGVTIRHAVAGLACAPTVGDCWDVIQQYFRLNPVRRSPSRRYLGPRNAAFVAADWLHHRLPMALASLGSASRRRQSRKLASRIDYVNDVFPYFTSRKFDFVRSPRSPVESFDARAYVATVCRGVARHLLAQRSDEWVLAGRAHRRHEGDLRWVLRQPHGNLLVRLGIWLSSKTLRRTTDTVTVDVPSFERAREAVPDGTAIVLLPSHRSFLDFVLCTYLGFARPDLGLGVPHVAAAVEFGRVPLLGWLLRAVHAFYVARGPGRENRDLELRVHALLDAGETVEFFIEGARSRSREFLAPKLGLLRCVQSRKRPCVLLPIAISYDRIPEESVFAREMAGAPKAPPRLGPLFEWLADVWRGRVQLGRVHIACGTPLLIDRATDVRRAARDVIAELRQAMALTSFHLDAYAAHSSNDLAVDQLRARIVAAGGKVLDSRLPVPADLDPLVARSFREHFAHFLTPDPDAIDPVVRPSVEEVVADPAVPWDAPAPTASTSVLMSP